MCGMALDQPPDSDPIGIGAFARMSGMSIPRLRRYHRAGLLVPARVDPTTGYRTYTEDQLTTARAIGRLRLADVPMDEVRAVMADDTSVRIGALESHRQRLKERLAETNRMIELVDQLIREERTTMTKSGFQVMEVAIRVHDVDSTLAFYREVLG